MVQYLFHKRWFRQTEPLTLTGYERDTLDTEAPPSSEILPITLTLIKALTDGQVSPVH